MTNTPGVLLIVENLPAPDDPRVWPEAIALRDGGFRVSVISPKGTARHRESFAIIDNIRVYRYSLPTGQGILAYAFEFLIALIQTFRLSLRVLAREGFDVIHAANPPDVFFLLGLFYRVLGKAFIFDQHELVPELLHARLGKRTDTASGWILGCALRFLEWCTYRSAHLVLVVNESLRVIAIKRGRCAPEKVVVVRNGPDLRRLPAIGAGSKRRAGDSHLLAYAGVMGVQDGVEYALYALHELVAIRGRTNVSLLLMGDGEQLPVLKDLARKLHLEGCTTFTGRLPRDIMYRQLAQADIGLSPDPKNGWNELCTMVKCMEYMAMSLPVVAFDLLETRNTAADAALYAVPNSVTDFADKIELLLDNEALRHEMGALGRRRVEQELNWQVSAARLIAAYDRLVPQHGGADAAVSAEQVTAQQHWRR